MTRNWGNRNMYCLKNYHYFIGERIREMFVAGGIFLWSLVQGLRILSRWILHSNRNQGRLLMEMQNEIFLPSHYVFTPFISYIYSGGLGFDFLQTGMQPSFHVYIN